MRFGFLTLSTARLFRMVVGSVLLLAGMALLVAHGLSWMHLQGLW
ncbi:putative membrane protein [Pseudomonas cerasi]|uniref:Putative membrane protein n=1 Tax=Pseudomonas cerasi TaxID=1583341 RepID=A0A193SWL6_9PSED|nr:putative membrane protein [Pseudomonas cerasi]SOS22524.1 putative membrane protein [Pseudomonas cerasi]